MVPHGVHRDQTGRYSDVLVDPASSMLRSIRGAQHPSRQPLLDDGPAVDGGDQVHDAALPAGARTAPLKEETGESAGGSGDPAVLFVRGERLLRPRGIGAAGNSRIRHAMDLPEMTAVPHARNRTRQVLIIHLGTIVALAIFAYVALEGPGPADASIAGGGAIFALLLLGLPWSIGPMLYYPTSDYFLATVAYTVPALANAMLLNWGLRRLGRRGSPNSRS